MQGGVAVGLRSLRAPISTRRSIAGSAVLAAWAVALLAALPASATTIRLLDFRELANRAELIVEGSVVALRTIERRAPISRPALEQMGVAPGTDPSSESEGFVEAPSPAAPRGAPVRGGPMLFTEVTFEVEEVIAGECNATLTLRVAGGEIGKVGVSVVGMPTFALGQRYVVFLRPGFRDHGDPFVGLYQGVFSIVPAAPGEDPVILNGEGDRVMGVEAGRLVVGRHRDPGEQTGRPRLAQPPTPTDSRTLHVQTTPAVERYWHPKGPGMRPSEFREAIRDARSAP